jgi:hypothetical protein
MNSVWPGELVYGGSSSIRSGVSLALRLIFDPGIAARDREPD